jgi:hypothetical protein
VRMARENRSWGYDRIAGALANLGYAVSDQTVGNILKRHGIPPAPERKQTLTWWEFVRFHLDVLLATDVFHSKIWHWFWPVDLFPIGFPPYQPTPGSCPWAAAASADAWDAICPDTISQSECTCAELELLGQDRRTITDDAMWQSPLGASRRRVCPLRYETTPISRDGQGGALVCCLSWVDTGWPLAISTPVLWPLAWQRL